MLRKSSELMPLDWFCTIVERHSTWWMMLGMQQSESSTSWTDWIREFQLFDVYSHTRLNISTHINNSSTFFLPCFFFFFNLKKKFSKRKESRWNKNKFVTQQEADSKDQAGRLSNWTCVSIGIDQDRSGSIRIDIRSRIRSNVWYDANYGLQVTVTGTTSLGLFTYLSILYFLFFWIFGFEMNWRPILVEIELSKHVGNRAPVTFESLMVIKKKQSPYKFQS